MGGKRKLKTYNNRSIIKLNILLTILFVMVICVGTAIDNDREEKLLIIANEDKEKILLEEEASKVKEDKIKETIPGIVCWGDSLTAGTGGEGTTYPNTLASLIKNNIYNIPVINMGVGGENTNTIIGRAGSVPFIVGEFTIPKDTSRVEITLKSSNGKSVAPLRQGDAGVNPVIINGIKGKIDIEQNSSDSLQYTYYFTRSEPGYSINVKDGTEVITSATDTYKDYINIIFIGQNKGWDDYNELISQQRSIINKLDRNKEKYLILGLTTGTSDERRGLEQVMANEYGNKYINLRKYLSSNGMQDANLKPTSEDLEYMKKGAVPPSLLVDEVHFTKDGYKLIGQVVYDRLIELEYFKDIEQYIK